MSLFPTAADDLSTVDDLLVGGIRMADDLLADGIRMADNLPVADGLPTMGGILVGDDSRMAGGIRMADNLPDGGCASRG